MTDEGDLAPEPRRHEVAPWLDDRMQRAFLAALRSSEADAAALCRLANSLPER
jgi:hypothetical protein